METKRSHTQKFVEMMLLVCSRCPDPISIVVIALADPCPCETPAPKHLLGGQILEARRGPLREGHAGLRDVDGQRESHDGRRRKGLMRWAGVEIVLMRRWGLVAYK
jgi:hypothetical protein